MDKIFATLFEYTLVAFRFTPGPGIPALLLWTTFNTAVRGLSLYLAIRLVMTALAHGSF